MTILTVFGCISHMYERAECWLYSVFFVRYLLIDQEETKYTPSDKFQAFQLIFQKWPQMAVVCTLYLARPRSPVGSILDFSLTFFCEYKNNLWHMTCDMWNVTNTGKLISLPNVSSLALWVSTRRHFKYFDSLTEWMIIKGACRTGLATPGLLKLCITL